MLYVKALTLDRFKSFKHANILFSKGFTAIVGPNGSGKSNICDALMFCLGETSLHRLRANKLEDLITNQPNRKGLAKAYAKLELDGDEHIEIIRGIRSDGKSTYKLNGKHMTRQEVVEVLERHGLHADERNTITQGEVGKITELNAKERRELIDAAAGIKEFEQKKEEALRELEKVNIKISEAQGIFEERFNFLKELENEKKIAENYMEMTARLRALNYSILIGRREVTKSAFDAYEKDLALLTQQKKEQEEEEQKIAEETLRINAERQELTRKFEEQNKSLGDINKRLQEISSMLAQSSTFESSYGAEIEKTKNEIERLKEDAKNIEKRVDANVAEITELNKKLSGIEKEVEKYGDFEIIENMQNAIYEANGIEDEIKAVEEKINNMRAEILQKEAQKEMLNKEIEGITNSIEVAKGEIKEIEQKLSANAQMAQSLQKEAEMLESQIKEIQQKRGELEQKIIELKEQKAVAYPKESSIKGRIAAAFDEKDGFFGTVADLCTYPEEYEMAIEAAAGGRLNYLVVDSIEVADKIIEYMKRNNIGRATFIPIKDIRVEPTNASNGLKALISVIKFEQKYSKAFEYVFGNTYIVNNIEEAKSKGIGKGRYVTLSGEVVEASGIVSGGAGRPVRTLASIEQQIKELSSQLEEIAKQEQSQSERLFTVRKSLAALEMENKLISEDKEKREHRMKELEAEIAHIKSMQEEIAGLENKKRALNEMIQQKAEKEEKLNEIRSKIAEYSKNAKRSEEGATSGIGESTRAAKDLKKEAESYRIKIAELNKENQMLMSRKQEIIENIAGMEKRIEELSTKIENNKKERERLEEEKKNIEEKIGKSSKESKEAYAKIAQLEEEALELGRKSGTIDSILKELDAKIKDIQIKRSQLEVRLNDINAELVAYAQSNIEVVKGKTIDEMEKEAGILESKINELGTVNLKAPEIYEQKKKEVGEAQEKLETLENERRAVMNLIDEVDKKKLNAFMSTFEEVNKNFAKMYNYVFPGSASLVLENENDPFSGGLEIKITGTSANRINALSGGEKALVSLMLLFAIHMYKPSGIYIFDEIDASLDKENVKKLSQLIKELSSNAQFIVVSHNDFLIVNADVAIGVVKSKDGSKVVGVEVNSIRNAASMQSNESQTTEQQIGK